MNRRRISEVLKEFDPGDMQKLLEMIMYADDLNCNIVDADLMEKSIKLQKEVYDAMRTGIGKGKATQLLYQYEQSSNDVHCVENEHWFKVGLKTGYVLCQILNEE